MKIKKLLFVLLTILLTISGYAQQTAPLNLEKVQWLLGEWKRTNVKPGRSGVERWTKISPDKFMGTGITMNGKDTVFSENLELIVKQDKIYYVAYVKENKTPIYFELTNITATGFVCENPAHDFPKKITYQLTERNLKATTSGNGKCIYFDFIRNQYH